MRRYRFARWFAAADGLFAYDTGCTDSGTHDEVLKHKLVLTLTTLSGAERRALVARLVREMWLSDEAIEQGYGAEDAGEFVRWLDDLQVLV